MAFPHVTNRGLSLVLFLGISVELFSGGIKKILFENFSSSLMLRKRVKSWNVQRLSTLIGGSELLLKYANKFLGKEKEKEKQQYWLASPPYYKL
jgi:hypothetical protein